MLAAAGVDSQALALFTYIPGYFSHKPSLTQTELQSTWAMLKDIAKKNFTQSFAMG
jgi:hypothetical protein